MLNIQLRHLTAFTIKLELQALLKLETQLKLDEQQVHQLYACQSHLLQWNASGHSPTCQAGPPRIAPNCRKPPLQAIGFGQIGPIQGGPAWQVGLCPLAFHQEGDPRWGEVGVGVFATSVIGCSCSSDVGTTAAATGSNN